MCNNEDATTTLGHSEELSVQNSVSDPVPEVCQRPEDGAKRPSSVDGQHSGDVLPDDPSRSSASSQSEKLQREVATRVIQSKPVASEGEGLARGSSHENINCSCGGGVDLREVAKVPHLRIAMRQDRARELVDLRVPGRAPAKRMPRDGRSLDARADGPVNHSGHSASISKPVRKRSVTRCGRMYCWQSSVPACTELFRRHAVRAEVRQVKIAVPLRHVGPVAGVAKPQHACTSWLKCRWPQRGHRSGAS